MPIQFKSRVYSSKTWALKKYKSIQRGDKDVHPDFKRNPKLKYNSKYKRWIVSWTIVYEKRRRRRKPQK